MFYFDEIQGTKILRSDYITDIFACFTLRSTNEEKLLQFLNPMRIIHPIQTHSANIDIVDSRNEYSNTDGLIIDNFNDVIYLKFADCTPLIFYDKKQKIACVSHAGWKGTAQKIAVKSVCSMQNNFNCEIKDIIALIGPAISLCCYEVSRDVREILLSTIKNKDGLFFGNNVDLKGINARQLMEIGVDKIDICPYCTSCDNGLFYSYRKENGTTKRHKAIVKLLKS